MDSEGVLSPDKRTIILKAQNKTWRELLFLSSAEKKKENYILISILTPAGADDREARSSLAKRSEDKCGCYMRISMLTPAGNSKCVRLSIVLSVGEIISISLLWTFIWKWSLASLSIKGDLLIA